MDVTYKQLKKSGVKCSLLLPLFIRTELKWDVKNNPILYYKLNSLGKIISILLLFLTFSSEVLVKHGKN